MFDIIQTSFAARMHAPVESELHNVFNRFGSFHRSWRTRQWLRHWTWKIARFRFQLWVLLPPISALKIYFQMFTTEFEVLTPFYTIIIWIQSFQHSSFYFKIETSSTSIHFTPSSFDIQSFQHSSFYFKVETSSTSIHFTPSSFDIQSFQHSSFYFKIETSSTPIQIWN